jgi:hypothetical protein
MDFFNSADFSWFKVDQFFLLCIALNIGNSDLLEFLSYLVWFLGYKLLYFIYLKVHAYSVVTYLENVRFLYLKNLENEKC